MRGEEINCMNKAAEHEHRPPVMVETVNGPVAPEELGLTDAHTHVWIEPLDGVSPGSPQLFDQEAIAAELNDYRLSGGGTLVDCQPGGCGRHGRVLRILSSASGVH
ncbi:MAG: phosphotriesterase, partial [Acidobacteria bacterium]|nr:phosphotriesterase [Acidobacteriota bacterium]